jgi:hypothetical protein
MVKMRVVMVVVNVEMSVEMVMLKGRKMPKGFGIGRKGVKHSPESIEKIVRNKIGKPLSLKNKFFYKLW